jgi:hypothetical protein
LWLFCSPWCVASSCREKMFAVKSAGVPFFFLGRIRVSPRWFESWVRQNDQILWFHWFSC